ncbi:MAG: ATP-binding protein, partial [Pseudomonadota bacterium]|nr:ATP-binding protein [Pseudomonadota bacterium]
MTDLFDNAPTRSTSYSAKDIEVLEGLEPIRRHPGMYIGGTDEHAMHHLVTEILDNAMDEAVAGHASRIELIVESDGWITVNDNGRGIPTGKHPRFPGKSALEVIMTTLHAGGKFKTGAYTTSGGLHGVGASVVNALSDHLEVEVARDRKLYRQAYKRGAPTGPLEAVGPAPNRRGTRIRFHPDPEIFGSDPSFKPERLFRLARSKAFLFSGVTIRWRCDPQLIRADAPILEETEFHFPGGLYDFLETVLEKRETLTPVPFHGRTDLANGKGRLEWAIAWPMDGIGFTHSYCNTVSTPQGGTHEAGLRAALLKGLKAYADLIGNKHASSITADDVLGEAGILLSVFLSDPTFQGQTKEKLTAVAASRWVESALRDRFDHWMAGDPTAATALLENAIDRAEARKRKKADTGTIRKSATRRLRLPGKLADCSQGSAQGTEIFIVEGDSAGGSAKQARNRQTQAILPLRGKILNVASASADKIRANQELTDLV